VAINYYNEHDPKAAAWLRELIKAGLISEGIVDERDIQLVQPADLAGFIQCHFFAGIGGWSYALRLAGWPDDKPVWTGSCPCQPFSAAGKGLGTKDPRHLWPQFRRLIRKCRPAIAFGEQVASAAGREWLDGVFADLEALGYANCAADLCAAGVGAPHIRQRLFWMAHTKRNSRRSRRVADKSNEGNGAEAARAHDEFGRCGNSRGVGDTNEQGCSREPLGQLGASDKGNWTDFQLTPCRDGKSRRIESGTFPLAHGVSGRVGLLRGYGNAIVPQVAAEFIISSMDAILDADLEAKT
jgi:DNA (cytosine-5)-methyltransferase 1